MERFLDAQLAVVHAFADEVQSIAWKHLYVDAEIEEVDVIAVQIVFLYVHEQDGALADAQWICKTSGPDRAIRELYLTMKAQQQQRDPFYGFELTIERDGSYRFDFWHDRARTIQGQWDQAHEDKLNGYLAHYLANRPAAD